MGRAALTVWPLIQCGTWRELLARVGCVTCRRHYLGDRRSPPPFGHIMPDHAGERCTVLSILQPHDHLHINQIRTFSRSPARPWPVVQISGRRQWGRGGGSWPRPGCLRYFAISCSTIGCWPGFPGKRRGRVFGGSGWSGAHSEAYPARLTGTAGKYSNRCGLGRTGMHALGR
jgi:hypothetical protein